MKCWLFSLLFVLFASVGFTADRHKLVINAETDEGKLLQQIGQESDSAKKIALMEEFAGKYPKHDGMAWVYSQMQTEYAKAGKPDKAIAAGAKLLEMDSDDLEAAYANLKAAEAQKDADAAIRWSEVTSGIARKIAKSSQPSAADEVEEWKRSVDYAKQVDTYTEYSLFALAVQGGPKTVELVEALEKRNPKSQYLPRVYRSYLMALSQKSPGKVAATAERLYANDPNSEELLLVLSNAALSNKQNEKTIQYSNKLVEVLKAKSKPEGMADADWETQKNAMLGQAYWNAGAVHAVQGQYARADQSLRAALPLIKGNDQLMAGALFYLGLSNYKLGQASKNKTQISDALRFSQQAAGMRGPYAAQAAKNVKGIQAEFGVK